MKPVCSIPQTFLFSATAHVHNKELNQLTKLIKFQSKTPFIININKDTIVAEKLSQYKVLCLKEDKDLFLYYFILQNPGRTLVFVNSIDSIRRLVPLLTLLKIKCYGIHSQMQQRQRLKNLDRFKQNSNCVLVASDVAARGLDIPDVEYVVHFQIPRTAETYVHRSGRTARSQKEGLSLALISAEETAVFKKISEQLTLANNVKDLEYDIGSLNRLRKAVIIARQIDEQEHKSTKEHHDSVWEQKAKGVFEVDDSSANIDSPSGINAKKIQYQLKKQKEILNSLLTERSKQVHCSEGLQPVLVSPPSITVNLPSDDAISSAINALKSKKAKSRK